MLHFCYFDNLHITYAFAVWVIFRTYKLLNYKAFYQQSCNLIADRKKLFALSSKYDTARIHPKLY